MKHAYKTRVKVVSATDDTAHSEFIDKTGTVLDHITDGGTGNTPQDPLHVVLFDDCSKESFWYEELEPQES